MRLISKTKSMTTEMDRLLKSLETSATDVPSAFELNRQELAVLWAETRKKYPAYDTFENFMKRANTYELFYNGIPIVQAPDSGVV